MSFNKANTYKVASKYVQQGRLHAAIEEYRKIMQAEPGNATVLNILGDLFAKVGNKAEAINCFLRIADHYKHHSSASKAIATLKKALKVDPDSPEIALKLGVLYAREHLWGEARQHYLAAAEQYLKAGQIEEAMNLYQRIAEHDPEKTVVQIKLAEIYLRTYQPELAYEAFVAAAHDLQQEGRQEEALKTYLQALKAKPEGQEALSAIINLYLQRAETLPAETLLKSLLRTRPEDPELLSLLRRVHQMAHDLKLAKGAISRAVEQDSSRVQYQVELVSASDRACATFFAAASEYQRQGKHQEALQSYLNALKIKPDSQTATAAAVNLYLQQGDTRAAVMLLRHLLRARPDDADLLSLLGQVHYQARDFDAAEQAIGRVIALDPERYQQMLDLASLLTRAGELDRALRLLDFVTETLRARGEEEKAAALLHEMLERDTNHLGALERLAALHEESDDTAPLIAALNALAQAAIYRSESRLAAKTLQRLVQLEPEEIWHQRLLQRVSGAETLAHSSEAQSAVAGRIDRNGEEAQIIALAPGQDELALELEGGEETEIEARAEIHLITPEASVPYFPEYHRFDVASETALSNSAPAPQPREAMANDDLLKGFRILSELAGEEPAAAESAAVESAVVVPVIVAEPVICLTEPTVQAAPSAVSVMPEAELAPLPMLAPPMLEATEQRIEEPREQALEEAIAPAIEVRSEPQPPAVQEDAADEPRGADEDLAAASSATTPSVRQVTVINIGWWPSTFPSAPVWRRTRPASRKKEEAVPASPRRGRSRRRFPRR
jgi:tetratricopeptide (TPR) repeat protein